MRSSEDKLAPGMVEHDWSRDLYCRRCGVALEETLPAKSCAPAGSGAGPLVAIGRVARTVVRATAPLAPGADA